jgi:hypothetical protein
MRLLRSTGGKTRRMKIQKKKKTENSKVGRLINNRIRCYGHV